jgi:SAM-dependent methyltransferase
MQHTRCHHPSDRDADRPAGGHDDVIAYYREIAPFYDAELEGRDDLGFWRRIAEGHRGGRFLELGAGSGRVTETLAPPAGEVVAIDVSPEMLGKAQVRLSDRENVRLVLADMLDLPFHATFDLIVAADDPFSHLTEDAGRDRALQGVARLLKPGGRFVLDALWLCPKEARAVAAVGGRVREHASLLDGQPMRVVERWQRVQDGTGATGRGRWGGYRGEPWDSERSQQLIVAARAAQ